MIVEKNPLLERVREIVSETIVYGLANPFDSDCIIDSDCTIENVSTVNNILKDKNNNTLQENDTTEVFSVSYQKINYYICDILLYSKGHFNQL